MTEPLDEARIAELKKAAFTTKAGFAAVPWLMVEEALRTAAREAAAAENEALDPVIRALADIAHSDDMTLDIARSKARRVYGEIQARRQHDR